MNVKIFQGNKSSVERAINEWLAGEARIEAADGAVKFQLSTTPDQDSEVIVTVLATWPA